MSWLLVNLSPLLANLGILGLLAWYLLFLNVRIAEPKDLKTKLLLGVGFGLSAAVMIGIPFRLEPGLIGDVRAVPIFYSAIVGGPVSAALCFVIAFSARAMAGGAGMLGGLAYIVVFFVIGLLYWKYHVASDRYHLSLKNLGITIFLATTVALPVIFLVPEDKQLDVLVTLWPGMYFGNLVGVLVLGMMFLWAEQRSEFQRGLIQANVKVEVRDQVLNGVLDATPASVALIDKEGNLHYVNKYWQDFAKESKSPDRNELDFNYLGVCKSTLEDPTAKIVFEQIDDLLAGRNEGFSLVYECHAPCRRQWFKMIVSPVIVGQDTFAVIMHFDVTDLVESQNKLEVARSKAEVAGKAKSRFISSIGHEVRTPLNAVLGFGQLLELELENEQHQTHLEEILRAGKHIQTLMDSIIEFADIENAELDGYFATIEVYPALLIAIEAVQLRYPKTTVRLEFEKDDFAGINVYGFKAHLIKALDAIIDNAYKFNAKCGLVRIACTSGPDTKVVIQVSDSGSGMTSEQLNQLFIPFDRTGIENLTIPGLGLGLVKAKAYLEQMHGAILVTSEVGQGTTVSIELLSTPTQYEGSERNFNSQKREA